LSKGPQIYKRLSVVSVDLRYLRVPILFQLNKDELEILRCQVGTSSRGGIRYLPLAFTEQGVAMLSSVLNSPIAQTKAAAFPDSTFNI